MMTLTMRKIKNITLYLLDKSTVPDRPHNKVFQARPKHRNNEEMAGFPAPDDIWIKEENSLLLPASPPLRPLPHLGLTATLF